MKTKSLCTLDSVWADDSVLNGWDIGSGFFCQKCNILLCPNSNFFSAVSFFHEVMEGTLLSIWPI